MINLANYFLNRRALYLSDLPDIQRLARCVARKYQDVSIDYDAPVTVEKGDIQAVQVQPDVFKVSTERYDMTMTREEAEKLRDVLTVICAQA